MEDLVQKPMETLKKLSKVELLSLIKEMKEDPATNLLIIMKEMEEEIQELKCLKDEVNKLTELIGNREVKANNQFEREHYENIQYTRRSNLEISGIPKIFDNKLEDKVLELFAQVGVDVDKTQVEACHRMYSKNGKEKKTIVRLTNRRLIEELMSKRKEVNKYVENVGFPRGTEIYFNDNLCP